MTSDERREAAERLREIDEAWPTLVDDLEEDSLRFGALAMAGILACVDDHAVFRRLADLIDPTCEDMDTHREDAFAPGKKACDGYFSCCRCNFNGRVFEGIGFGDMATMEVRYCPNCGARVVRDLEEL